MYNSANFGLFKMQITSRYNAKMFKITIPKWVLYGGVLVFENFLVRYPGQNISKSSFFNHIWTHLPGVNGNPLEVFVSCTKISQGLCFIPLLHVCVYGCWYLYTRFKKPKTTPSKYLKVYIWSTCLQTQAYTRKANHSTTRYAFKLEVFKLNETHIRWNVSSPNNG